MQSCRLQQIFQIEKAIGKTERGMESVREHPPRHRGTGNL
mgnify:CR=1 FL=1